MPIPDISEAFQDTMVDRKRVGVAAMRSIPCGLGRQCRSDVSSFVGGGSASSANAMRMQKRNRYYYS